MSSTTLFVYGTLKRGGSNQAFMLGQHFLGPACTLTRYRLFDSGAHPCLVEDRAHGVAVEGELWSVDALTLARLDEFELGADQFARRVVEIAGVAGPIHAYFFDGDVSQFRDAGTSWTEPSSIKAPPGK